jgi:hypothetical protein
MKTIEVLNKLLSLLIPLTLFSCTNSDDSVKFTSSSKFEALHFILPSISKTEWALEDYSLMENGVDTFDAEYQMRESDRKLRIMYGLNKDIIAFDYWIDMNVIHRIIGEAMNESDAKGGKWIFMEVWNNENVSQLTLQREQGIIIEESMFWRALPMGSDSLRILAFLDKRDSVMLLHSESKIPLLKFKQISRGVFSCDVPIEMDTMDYWMEGYQAFSIAKGDSIDGTLLTPLKFRYPNQFEFDKLLPDALIESVLDSVIH